MVAFAAVSFPEQTANSVYTLLEFVKEHPTASSIGIVVGAGALLGPDLLAVTAVAGGCASSSWWATLPNTCTLLTLLWMHMSV